jgi:hypothetical protein
VQGPFVRWRQTGLAHSTFPQSLMDGTVLQPGESASVMCTPPWSVLAEMGVSVRLPGGKCWPRLESNPLSVKKIDYRR